MDRNKIHELLDKSCADALHEWWATHNRTPSQERASDAIKDLKSRLASFEKPNYDDEYILSAYVIVHQIKHINMAWQAFSSLKEGRVLVPNRWDSLRIVDLGAGTSAGRIGAALMVAEAMRGDHNIERVYFDEIDISDPMLKMGKLVWQAFEKRVRNEYKDIDLIRAVDVLDSRQHVDWGEVGEKLDFETWLSAFHVIYQDQNHNNLKKDIRGLYERVDPIAGAFSCYHSSGWSSGEKNLSLMQAVFPPFYRKSSCSPPSSGKKCPTSNISDWAVNNGFITEEQYRWGWRPFLHEKDCTLLYGYNIPF